MCLSVYPRRRRSKDPQDVTIHIFIKLMLLKLFEALMEKLRRHNTYDTDVLWTLYVIYEWSASSNESN